MRIGLFTEHQCSGADSTEPIVAALVANRPIDCFIVEYTSTSNLETLLAAHEFTRRVEEDALDLLHVATSGPLAVIGLFLASRFSIPLITSFAPAASAESVLHRAYLRTLARQSRRLLVSSKAARDKFMRAGTSPSNMVGWRPGVDSTTFAPSKRSNALRERWRASEARPVVIYAGALSDDRGVGRLVEMEAALHRTRPMHQLVIAGDGPCRAELQARCWNAMFLGAVPHAQMPEVLASADLFVSPGEAASSNLAVLEAQASGLPVVVMQRGSARERMTTASGIVCRSSADLIVDTAALVRTDGRRRSMSAAAREWAMRQKWAAGLLPIYAEYRAAAESSRVRRDLEPAFVAQSRRL